MLSNDYSNSYYKWYSTNISCAEAILAGRPGGCTPPPQRGGGPGADPEKKTGIKIVSFMAL